jgi:hypothetical protein
MLERDGVLGRNFTHRELAHRVNECNGDLSPTSSRVLAQLFRRWPVAAISS